MDNLLRRSDIDLLRAVAVLLVIFYHYFPSFISFGYLGVDIFLVISGYLMFASYESSKNGFHFIIKRAYRLIPGLLSVALICFLLIFLVLRQDMAYDFAKEILTSLASISNYYYFTKIGYFDSDAQNKIFLMSWTLSLEFQFYLLLAFSYGLLFKNNKILILVLIISFISSYLVSDSARFFLITSRLWEFLAGSLLYKYYHTKNNQMGFKKNAIPIISILLILIVTLINYYLVESKSIIHQVIAVLFSILVLSKKINLNYIFRFISIPMNWVGETSYSIYLIHWPVLFFSIAFNLDSSALKILTSLFLVVFLGRINFLLVEKKLTAYLKRRSLLFPIFLIILFVISIYTFIERSKLINKTIVNHSGVSCDISKSMHSKELSNFCTRFGQGENKKILLWGDSHITRMVRPLINNINNNESIFMISHNACPPLVNTIYFINKSNMGPCNDDSFGSTTVEYINHVKPDIVILAARWPMYFGGYDDSNSEFLIANSINDSQKITSSISQSIKSTILGIDAKKIIVILPPRELFKQNNLSQEYLMPGNYFKDLNSNYEIDRAKLKKLIINNKEVLFFDIDEKFCEDINCSLNNVQMNFYQDTNHISNDGADYIFNYLKLLIE